MKTLLRPFALGSVLIVLSVAAFIPACSTIDKTLFDQKVSQTPPEVTGTNAIVSTNILSSAALTNQDGTITPAKVETVVKTNYVYTYGPPGYETNLSLKPAVQGTVQGAGALPFPFAGTAAAVALWGLSIYGAARNAKTKSEAVSIALVKSVEAGRDFLKSTPEGQALDAKFTQVLESHQDAAGALKQIQSLLADHTS